MFPRYQVFQEEKSSTASEHESKRVADSILQLFPGFDAFMLPPPSDDAETMRSINEKRDQVNHLFLSGLEKFKHLIRSILAPKHSINEGEFVTGEG